MQISFGYAVSLNGYGNIRAASAINYNSGSHTNAGRVQIFNKYNDQLGLDLTGSQSNENFGNDIALNMYGNRMVVGSKNRGKVNMYEISKRTLAATTYSSQTCSSPLTITIYDTFNFSTTIR